MSRHRRKRNYKRRKSSQRDLSRRITEFNEDILRAAEAATGRKYTYRSNGLYTIYAEHSTSQ